MAKIKSSNTSNEWITTIIFLTWYRYFLIKKMVDRTWFYSLRNPSLVWQSHQFFLSESINTIFRYTFIYLFFHHGYSPHLPWSIVCRRLQQYFKSSIGTVENWIRSKKVFHMNIYEYLLYRENSHSSI